MTRKATPGQRTTGSGRRRWSAVAVATAFGVSGIVAATIFAVASTDTTEPVAEGSAPAVTAAVGTAA